MKKQLFKRAPLMGLTMTILLSVGAHAADYDFDGTGKTDYYQGSSYEEVYGTQYNYGGRNIVDYQIPELEYGLFSTTQTGVMERTRLPGLQARVGGTANGAFGINESVTGTLDAAAELPFMTQTPQSGGGNGNNFTIVGTIGSKKAFTKLADLEPLSNGAIGHFSIPSIGVNKYYVWEGETTNSMSKGVGHFESSSVWDGNVCLCGHNRGAKYVIGSIKDLSVGDKIIYTTSLGTRTYEVETVAAIRNDDWSYLGDTPDNRITLVTCVAGDSSQRWCVQALEK